MLGIKYVIDNKLQNNTDYNTNTRFTLEHLSYSLWHITMEYYNHVYKVL